MTDRLQWTGEVSPATLEEYTVARDQFVQHLAKRPEFISIYQHGQPTVLGISDVDLICVVDDRLTESSPKDFSARALFGSNHLAFPGEPVIVPRTVFHHLQEAFPFPSLQRIYGEALLQENYTEEERRHLLAMHMVDQLGFYCLGHARLLGTNRRSIRPTLTHLNGLTGDVKIVQTITGKNVAQHFIEEVQVLRCDWFKTGPDRLHRLETLWFGAGEVLVKAILALNQYLMDRRWIVPERPCRASIATGDGGVVVFVPMEGVSASEWVSRIHQWNLPTSWRRKGTWRSPVVALPLSFGVQLGFYAREGKGPMTQALRRSFRNRLPIADHLDPIYSYWLRRRIAVMDQQAEFLLANRFQFSGLFMTVADPPHRRQNVQRDLGRRMKEIARTTALDLIRPFRMRGTVGHWPEIREKTAKIPTILFVSPSHRGNRGDDAMYAVTRRAFAEQLGPIRSYTLLHREVTPEEVRDVDLGRPDTLLSLRGFLITAHPMVEGVGRVARGLAVRVAGMINFILPDSRRLRIQQVRTTVQAVVHGGWQSESILHQCFFAMHVSKVHASNLG